MEKTSFAGLVRAAARLPEYVEFRRVHDQGLRLGRAARKLQGRGFWDASAERYERAVSVSEQAMRQAESEAVQRAERDCAVLRAELERLEDRAAAARLRGLYRDSERLEAEADSVRALIAERVGECGQDIQCAAAARVAYEEQRVARKGMSAFRARMAAAKDRARIELREDRRAEWELRELDRELSSPGGWAKVSSAQQFRKVPG